MYVTSRGPSQIDAWVDSAVGVITSSSVLGITSVYYVMLCHSTLKDVLCCFMAIER